MPLVTVALLPHPAEEALLSRVADAVADALGLAAGDVIALTTPVRTAAVSGRGPLTTRWPIVTVHGSDRGEEAMRAALTAAEHAIMAWGESNGVAIEGVWTEWALPLNR